MAVFDVVAIFKNETWNLQEWLDHYTWQGARRFYLCDNGSTDKPLKILQAYIESEKVIYKYEEWKPYQLYWYSHVIAQIQESEDPPQWILAADLDEFWYSSQGTLAEVLPTISSNIDVIATKWKVMGPVKDTHEHPKSLREACFYRRPELGLQKQIFRTFSVQPNNVGIHEINEIDTTRTIMDTTNFHCNHYSAQSYNYWTQVKLTRGFVNADHVNDHFSPYDMEGFQKDFELSTVLDTELRDQFIHTNEIIAVKQN